jgi:hypothetical protein
MSLSSEEDQGKRRKEKQRKRKEDEDEEASDKSNDCKKTFIHSFIDQILKSFLERFGKPIVRVIEQ